MEESVKRVRCASGATFSKYDTSCAKGLAILLMLVHHCFLSPNRYKGQVVDFSPFSESEINAIALSFKICVAIFVFISGYGIACSMMKMKKAGHYSPANITVSVAKRLVSLIGGYLFVFAIAQLWSLIVVRDGRWLKVYGGGALGIVHFAVDALGLGELLGMPLFLATFWYMSLAILIVLLVPILFDVANRYGYPLVFGLALLLRVFFRPTSDATFAYLPDYLGCVVMGMWAAEGELISKFDLIQICSSQQLSGTLKLIATATAGLACMFLRQITRTTALLPFWDSIIALIVCCVMHSWIDRIPIINTILSRIGKHSMNVFLTHNFVRIMWYYDFTYSFRKWWLIILVLLLVSMAVSICIEFLKKILGYDRLLLHLRDCCDSLGVGLTS